MTIEEKATQFVAQLKNIQSDSDDDKATRSSLHFAYSEGFKEATRWISVEEILPEEDGQYLVKYNDSTMLLWFNTFHKCWDDTDGDDFYCKQNEVSAWRPIEFE